jgi:hypothetical protein
MLTLLGIVLVLAIAGYVFYLFSRVGKTADKELQSILIAGEQIRHVAMQRRIYALAHRRTVAASTTGRFVVLTRRLLGGYTIFDIRWQDIKSANITVGMISATLKIDYSANLSDTAMGEGAIQTCVAAGLAIEPAQALYRDCQSEDQSWREKRRIRSIEEMRAKAGGVQIATGVYPTGSPQISDRPLELTTGPQSTSPDTMAEKLGKAKELLVQGLITDSEYEAIKARIISSV